MPTYRYACAECGAFDAIRPMRESGSGASCPICAGPSRRVFGAPALRALPAGLRSALDAQHRSADAPRVATSVPGRAGRTQRRATDPRQLRLPRP
ncbi:zinc ribbon domain-containing protein [Pseudonocardia sp. KRD-184]|uniref:Zinc ribbon domain-containing protein n=1 Tax=Pseudonocardia oceani TaxID=2792013 RepID=A0ABS6UGN6_9PSEU|nr:zinc ribbon domain-containing protein [Pseudonocardia oceani]MBW0090301.1 zinc ribbon domain-containing protein [Pseudonocardia oceani]MBW0098477.1 zinc ribbon domain-containing protein [Pseudonocardia oceani]MBW0109918.1 zinc ribbon domain-containing protein [Pseudonocardia oceani]MBW0120361.1 zinc ribbon domain-containing protein [Pseudonocardia oceani]MBW0131385.1 zinc ribbon domain-containing protein [Pseudonocardia oceani]